MIPFYCGDQLFYSYVTQNCILMMMMKLHQLLFWSVTMQSEFFAMMVQSCRMNCLETTISQVTLSKVWYGNNPNSFQNTMLYINLCFIITMFPIENDICRNTFFRAVKTLLYYVTTITIFIKCPLCSGHNSKSSISHIQKFFFYKNYYACWTSFYLLLTYSLNIGHLAKESQLAIAIPWLESTNELNKRTLLA